MLRRTDAPRPTPAPPGTGPRYLGLEAREWAVVLAGATLGVAVGMFLHYVESLPTDVAYLADLVRAFVYVASFVVFMVGVGQLTTGRRTLLLMVVPFALAAIVASGFGPVAAPPAVVGGRHDLTVDGRAAESGSAACTWAAGREKIERVNGHGTLSDVGAYTLDVDRGRLTVTLELHGGRYMALGSEAFATLTGPAEQATLALPLFQTLPTAPSDIPAAVEAIIGWTCDPAPAR